MSKHCQFGRLAWKEASKATANAQEALSSSDYNKTILLSVAAERLQILCRACNLCDTAGYFFPRADETEPPQCGLSDRQMAMLGGIAASELHPADLANEAAKSAPAIIEPRIDLPVPVPATEMDVNAGLATKI